MGRRAWRDSFGVALVAPVALVALAGAAMWGRDTDLADRTVLHDAYGALKGTNTSSGSAFYSMLRRAMLRHPAEPYFPLLGGLVAWSSKRDAMPWLTRSLERDPMNGRAHFATAFVVASRGRLSQALLELRLAATDDRGLITPVARTATAWTRRRALLLSVVPDDPQDGAVLLTRMAQHLRAPEDADLRKDLLALACERAPENVDARVELTRDLIAALQSDSPRCQGTRSTACREQVRNEIGRIAELDPSGSSAINLHAEALIDFGRPGEAVALMSGECPKKQDRASCARLWLKAAALARDLQAISAAVDALTLGCTTPARCVRNCEYAGDVLMAADMPGLALKNYEQAAMADGSGARWMRVAAAASLSGAHTQALRALERAQQAAGPSAELQRRIEGERRSMTQNLVGVGSK